MRSLCAELEQIGARCQEKMRLNMVQIPPRNELTNRAVALNFVRRGLTLDDIRKTANLNLISKLADSRLGGNYSLN
jgi:hypothetical protein